MLINCRKLLPTPGLCRQCIRRMSSSREYKGEEYDPNKRIVPSIPKITAQYNPEVDTASKTTVTVLNSDVSGLLLVDGVSPIGFTLNNSMRVLGPMALLAKSVFQWKVTDVDKLTPEAFSLFYLLEPKLDILVIGYGDMDRTFDPGLLRVLLTKRRMGLEVLPTEHAIATFNFLNSEGRYVAGAFIPPESMVYTEDDVYERAQMHGGRDSPEADFSPPKFFRTKRKKT